MFALTIEYYTTFSSSSSIPFPLLNRKEKRRGNRAAYEFCQISLS